MSFDDLLKALHQEYLSSLPQKIVTIEAQLAAGNVAELRESFHKLKGTGRTYGLPEISELAAAMEEICKNTPNKAAIAVVPALEIMRDIHATRLQQKEFPLGIDSRFLQVRQLLQK